ncbi:S1 RNA-binding domain-containing protein [Pseudomonas caricapapayae]|uniref:S1 RNA-binding domain-containing protein n=1 Tax=Pseudomonas caricapapayae TaxID=46678 RepID=UPI0016811054|nr:S1 RNA-binding domain-containing protein [Pseudomonas caricapapayae]
MKPKSTAEPKPTPINAYDSFESADTFLRRLNIGDVVTGRVRMVMDYGVFIDLGPMDGLLHNSKINEKNGDTNEIFTEGREIDLYVFSINRDKCTLGLSQYPRQITKLELPKHESGKENIYAVGQQLSGHAKSITETGIHFENADGFKGFISNRAISCDPTKIDEIKKQATDGEELQVKIINVNGKNIYYLEIVEYIRPNLEAYFHFQLERDVPFDGEIVRIDKDEIFLKIENGIYAFVMKRNLPGFYIDKNLKEEFEIGQVLSVKSKGYSSKLLNVFVDEV